MEKLIPRILGLLKLDNRYMEEVMADKNATGTGFAILAVPVVSLFLVEMLYLGEYFKFAGIGGHLFVLLRVIFFVWAMNFIANNYFEGKGDMFKSFRAIAYSQILYWIPVILIVLTMLLGIDLSFWSIWAYRLAIIWGLVVAYKVFQIEYRLKEQDAIVCLVITIVASYIFQFIFSKIFFSSFSMRYM
ncbi:YIP1 family protein [Patescibacteria group bacterium]|nr:YIP1 family protein [Patescibacteria group bacterium]